MSVLKYSNPLNNNEPESEIADYISAKGYLPNDNSLPQITLKKKKNDDVSYILSKLTDEELITLLNDEPKKNIYDLNDVVRIALESKTIANKNFPNPSKNKQEDITDFRDVADVYAKKLPITSVIGDPQIAFHKLGNREIFPQNQKNKVSFLALKKLQNLLYNRSLHRLEDENLNDEKKELLFDILVTQLKTLCCKSGFKTPSILNSPLDTILGKKSLKLRKKSQFKSTEQGKEFIFLILNDEINSNDDDELVIVNPDTLERNSSVLILGPVTAPLTDGQLKIVMNRISDELSKPEYETLLQQLSDGTLSKSNLSVMKNFIYGPETRRYIKAHRCNHQSKLAKIYGGPKWLICTGYLNINTPSLYD